MDRLSRLESESIYVIREAYRRYARIAVLWSMGKDSTSLLWLCRKAFFGRIPFPVIHIDTSYKLLEISASVPRFRASTHPAGSGVRPGTCSSAPATKVPASCSTT
jgi:3'-phosphoadenosine 5'-phosphosulfate sulfotransferase (PAPS reductase)/FAD synthetase